MRAETSRRCGVRGGSEYVRWRIRCRSKREVEKELAWMTGSFFGEFDYETAKCSGTGRAGAVY